MIGKIIGAPIIDFVGGRPAILTSCVGIIIGTLVFAIFGNFYVMMIVGWSITRLTSSLSWPSIMKMVSLW